MAAAIAGPAASTAPGALPVMRYVSTPAAAATVKAAARMKAARRVSSVSA